MSFCFPLKPDHVDSAGRMDLFAKYGPTLNYHKLDQCFCEDCKTAIRATMLESGNHLKLEKDKIIKDGFIDKNSSKLCAECLEHYHSWPHLYGGFHQSHILTIQEIDILIKDYYYHDILDILYSEKGDAAKTLLTKVNHNKCFHVMKALQSFFILETISLSFFLDLKMTSMIDIILKICKSLFIIKVDLRG